MLFIGILGLIALGLGIKNIIGSPEVQRRDVILIGIGFIAAAIGLHQANRLRHRKAGVAGNANDPLLPVVTGSLRAASKKSKVRKR